LYAFALRDDIRVKIWAVRIGLVGCHEVIGLESILHKSAVVSIAPRGQHRFPWSEEGSYERYQTLVVYHVGVVVEAGQAPGQGKSHIIQGCLQVGLVRLRVIVCAAQLAVDTSLEGRSVRRGAVGSILTGDLSRLGDEEVVPAL
jgi:hypothetical protein